MARQLTLLETPPSWHLDEPTKEAGRRGVAEARAALQAAVGSARRGARPAARPASPTEHRSPGRSAA